jgi:hypothetical protein
MNNKIDLIKSSDHLYYEIWMLRLLANKLLNYYVGSEFSKKEISTSSVRQVYSHTTSPEVYSYSTDSVFTPPSKLEKDLVIGNALLESYGIHLRSLIGFFYPDRKNAHKDDVFAEHYFSNSNSWEIIRPFRSEEELKKIIDRVSKQIAHLTYSRNDPTKIKEDWPILESKNIIFDVLKVFLEYVDKSLLSKRWDKPL